MLAFSFGPSSLLSEETKKKTTKKLARPFPAFALRLPSPCTIVPYFFLFEKKNEIKAKNG
jgi:hypothetical protein